jgi:hypothetical protein
LLRLQIPDKNAIAQEATLGSGPSDDVLVVLKSMSAEEHG